MLVFNIMQIVETWEMLFSFDSRVGDTLLSTPDHSGLIFDQKLNHQETTLMKQKRHVNYVQLGVYRSKNHPLLAMPSNRASFDNLAWELEGVSYC